MSSIATNGMKCNRCGRAVLFTRVRCAACTKPRRRKAGGLYTAADARREHERVLVAGENGSTEQTMPQFPDTDSHVYFYGPEFYVLSNFSAFNLTWRAHNFDTSEQAYHWEKFLPPSERDKVLLANYDLHAVRLEILRARSAHDAYKFAEANKAKVRSDWPEVRVPVMRDILRAKVQQHEYVRRKLLETGERVLVEDSWRDGFWGWGPDKNGRNMLGELWMEVRAELWAGRQAAG